MEQIRKYFNRMYNETYDKTLAYVLTKCGRKDVVEDILQEVYLELLKVLEQKKVHYIKSPEAFVLQLAKSKVYRYYSEREQQKVCDYVEELEETAVFDANRNTAWEDVISQIKRYLTEDTKNTLEIISYGSMYRDYKKLIEKGELPADILININGEDYTMEKLEEIWVNNPWLEELDWENKKESTADEIDSYIVIYEDDNVKNEAAEVEAGEITVSPTKTPDK